MSVVRLLVEMLAAYENQTAPMDNQILTLERQSRTLAMLRDTLLPNLLSGKSRVAEDVLSELHG